MKKYRLTTDFFTTANASALHMLTTGVVTNTAENVVTLAVDTFADNNNIESAALGVITEKNVVNEQPYTVKLSQYVRIGSVIVVKATAVAFPQLVQTLDELCEYWEYSTGFDSKTIAWGISRVQKTDFSDPVGDANAIAGITCLVYETPRQLRNSPNPSRGPIVGIDDKPLSLLTKPNQLASGNKPTLALATRQKANM